MPKLLENCYSMFDTPTLDLKKVFKGSLLAPCSLCHAHCTYHCDERRLLHTPPTYLSQIRTKTILFSITVASTPPDIPFGEKVPIFLTLSSPSISDLAGNPARKTPNLQMIQLVACSNKKHCTFPFSTHTCHHPRNLANTHLTMPIQRSHERQRSQEVAVKSPSAIPKFNTLFRVAEQNPPTRGAHKCCLKMPMKS